MIDWGAFSLFLFILMRMLGFVLFSPILSRNGVPAPFRTGLSLVMAVSVQSLYGGEAPLPGTALELAFRLALEMGLGLILGLMTRFFFFIPEQAGEIVDTQMGMSMARTYDPGSASSPTPTANILDQLMLVLFFAAGGHVALMRLMLTSGEIVPFGAASLGTELADRAVVLFTECVLIAVRMALPILGAELLGQVGMGILMKAIPQINVFALNIELKIFVGMSMLIALIPAIGPYLIDAEARMLGALEDLLSLAAP